MTRLILHFAFRLTHLTQIVLTFRPDASLYYRQIHTALMGTMTVLGVKVKKVSREKGRVIMSDTEKRLAELEATVKKLQADEFIGAGFVRRSATVMGYWLFGVALLYGGWLAVSWLWGMLAG